MPQTALEELQHVFSLLRLEQRAELQLYQEQMLQTALPERRKRGMTWYPLIITETEVGYGQKLILTLERTSHRGTPHSFQSGKVAALFAAVDGEASRELFVTGIVIKAKKDQIRLVLYGDDLPDWLEDGEIGLNLFYDETSYREMEFAMQRVMYAENNRLAELREILLGFKPATFAEPTQPSPWFSELNPSQNEAVQWVSRANDLAIVHGPPGTGKTTTLVRAIQWTLQTESFVMDCAPSNTAADMLTEQLGNLGIRVVRIGHPARITERLHPYTLDTRISKHREFKLLKQLRKEAVQTRSHAMKFKRTFGPKDRTERREQLAQIKDILKNARQLEKTIVAEVLASAQVVTCTLVGAAHELLHDKFFSTVFIDEAAQALECACWIPIMRAGRVVLALEVVAEHE